MTEANVRDLDLAVRAAKAGRLMAPVELVGFARREPERDEDLADTRGALRLPAPGIAPHTVVAALVALALQGLE